MKTFDLKNLNNSTNKPSTKKEFFENLLKNNSFKSKQEVKYKLWRLEESTSTLYIRTYENKIQCVLYGDFDPHIYLTLKYEDVEKRLGNGENLFIILLSDNKK
jgi:hypothetical protein